MFDDLLPAYVAQAREIRRAQVTTRYSAYPDHPLHDVPQDVLDAVRENLRDVVEWGDIEKMMIEPLADSCVQALVEAGYEIKKRERSDG